MPICHLDFESPLIRLQIEKERFIMANHSFYQTPGERLARVLLSEQDPALAPIIQRARAGYYDETRSDIPNPSAALVHDLRHAGYDDLAARAYAGEWDPTGEDIERASVVAEKVIGRR